jgi:hypothetical protein
MCGPTLIVHENGAGPRPRPALLEVHVSRIGGHSRGLGTGAAVAVLEADDVLPPTGSTHEPLTRVRQPPHRRQAGRPHYATDRWPPLRFALSVKGSASEDWERHAPALPGPAVRECLEIIRNCGESVNPSHQWLNCAITVSVSCQLVTGTHGTPTANTG